MRHRPVWSGRYLELERFRRIGPHRPTSPRERTQYNLSPRLVRHRDGLVEAARSASINAAL